MDIFIPDTETKLYGLIGETLSHSISPVFHNNGFRKLDFNAVYLMLEVEKGTLEEYVAALRTLNFSGWNVTIPYKEDIMNHLDGLSSLARDAGAVNTVLNRRGRLTGYNTDVIGIQRQIEEAGFPVKGKKAVVIGAGGAARAVLVALEQLNLAEVAVINRTASRAEELVNIFENRKTEIIYESASLDEEEYSELVKDADLIINTTPVGMYDNVSEKKIVINTDYLKEDQFVIDMVYNPLKTPLLKKAEEIGAQTSNGLPTLIYQAEAAFKLWIQKMPDKKDWYKIAEEEIKKMAEGKEKNKD
ncbi:MAG: shikimate dehydrogenase [Bacillota bacterium]